MPAIAPGRRAPVHGGSSMYTPAILRDKRYVTLGLVFTALFVYISMRSVPSAIKPSRTGLRTPDGSELTKMNVADNTHKELTRVTEKYDPGPKRPLNEPHGGVLKDLLANKERARELTTKIAPKLQQWTLSNRQLCDIELLMNGGFSPLDGFLDEENYKSVVENMRLTDKYNKVLWPMPITLDITDEFASKVTVGDKIALRDEFYNLIAVMTISSKYIPDKENEAINVFRTSDRSHPAVDYLFHQAGSVYLGGPVEGVRLPIHYDFPELRRTPRELREYVDSLGWSKFLAFQTRNPMHRAHIELTRIAAEEHGVGVILHPVVGSTKPGDVPPYIRVMCYKAILDSHRYYKVDGAGLSLLPLAMRMAGPREAMWHVLIRKNFGASHFVVGRDHAGCKSASGDDFYGAYDAQELVNRHKAEIGMNIVKVKKVLYVPAEDRYVPQDRLPEGVETLSLSGTQFRKMMNAGEHIPAWFSDPGVIKILQTASPPKHLRGFAIFFTGLSGGGKTTISHALIARLRELLPTRHLTILDGDVARTHLSAELGFSVRDRNINVARMGYVTSEATRHGGLVVASTIAPFEKSRAQSRELVEITGGGFVLVHISTTAEECADRDVKGLYAKARAGEIALTGVSHPYEFPDAPDLTINAGVVPVDTSVSMILSWLYQHGYLLEDQVGKNIANVDLKSDGVLTTGVPDPASRLCVKTPGGTAGSGKPRMVFIIPADSAASTKALENSFREAHSGTSGGVVLVSFDVLEKLAKKVVTARMQELAQRQGKSAATVDDAIVAITEDDAPEIAFNLWQSARLAGAQREGQVSGDETLPSETDWIKSTNTLENAPDHLAVVLPIEAQKLLSTLLRLDPCASVAFASISAEKQAGLSAALGLQNNYAGRVAASDSNGKNFELTTAKDTLTRAHINDIIRG